MKTIESETSFFSFEVNFWVILLIIAVVLLFIISVFLLKRIFNLEDELEKEIKSLNMKSNQLIIKIEDEIKKQMTNSINIKPQKTNIQTEVIEPKLKPLEEEKSKPIDLIIPPPIKQIDEPKEEMIEPAIKKQEVFYMPAPSLSGDFDINNTSDSFKETVTLYKFFIHKNNPDKADFEFYSDAIGIKNAVNYPDKYLESVCNINSGYNPNTKKIITETKGTAQKTRDKWVVNSNNKAKIKYE